MELCRHCCARQMHLRCSVCTQMQSTCMGFGLVFCWGGVHKSSVDGKWKEIRCDRGWMGDADNVCVSANQCTVLGTQVHSHSRLLATMVFCVLQSSAGSFFACLNLYDRFLKTIWRHRKTRFGSDNAFKRRHLRTKAGKTVRVEEALQPRQDESKMVSSERDVSHEGRKHERSSPTEA